MKKNLLSLVLAWIMLLTLFAGCGETPASDTSPAPEPSVTDAEPAPAPEPPQESPEPEISAEDSAEAPADTLDLRPPLTYPLADGDVTFTFLHVEPQLGPMSGQMNMSSYGDFDTIAAGTEYIGVTPQWQSLSQMSGDTQFNLIIASGDYPDVIGAVEKYYVGGLIKAREDDVIIPLDDYIGDNMPEYWNLVQEDEALRRAVTVDDGAPIWPGIPYSTRPL